MKRTPLMGSLAYFFALVAFDLALIFGLGWGMEGAGYAAALSQWFAAAVMLWLLARQQVRMRVRVQAQRGA